MDISYADFFRENKDRIKKWIDDYIDSMEFAKKISRIGDIGLGDVNDNNLVFSTPYKNTRELSIALAEILDAGVTVEIVGDEPNKLIRRTIKYRNYKLKFLDFYKGEL